MPFSRYQKNYLISLCNKLGKVVINSIKNKNMINDVANQTLLDFRNRNSIHIEQIF